VAMVDYNKKQIDGSTDDVMALGDLRAKWEAFGWTVFETNGNDMKSLLETFAKAKAEKGNGKPIVILLTTIMGKGVDFMEDKHTWHGKAPDDEQLKQALAQLEETLGDY